MHVHVHACIDNLTFSFQKISFPVVVVTFDKGVYLLERCHS